MSSFSAVACYSALSSCSKEDILSAYARMVAFLVRKKGYRQCEAEELVKDFESMYGFKIPYHPMRTIMNQCAKLGYLTYAPILFISAKTGQRVDKLFDLINKVAANNAMRVSTSMLNEVINEAIAVVQPPSDKGRRLKILYATQAQTKPPTFVIFVNNKELFHFSYERYLVNQIRSNFDLEGTPIRIISREKGEKED